MKLLKQFNEDAMGAGDISTSSFPLFSKFVQRSTPQPVKPILIKYEKTKKKQKKTGVGALNLGESLRSLFELDDSSAQQSNPAFDSTEVISRLKSLEDKDSAEVRDSTTFGLEDDNGDIVRVTISNDQAQEFEKALQAFMANVDNDEELPEIAELLFKLKDQFNIVNVVWPEIAEDEEETQTIEGGDGMGGDINQPGNEEAVPMDDIPMDDGASTDASVNTGDLLTQVIDMMRADAEARKADAEARTAEAKNREAEAAVNQAHSRVKHEEELLDMDTYNKSRKEEEKESKRLAQLAQWRRDVQKDSSEDEDFGLTQSITGGHEENEEIRRPTSQKAPVTNKTLNGRVHPHEVARFILNRMR